MHPLVDCLLNVSEVSQDSHSSERTGHVGHEIINSVFSILMVDIRCSVIKPQMQEQSSRCQPQL